MTQKDAQWVQDRLGRITASRFGDAMAKPDSNRYQRYKDDLIDERIGLMNLEEYIHKPWFLHGKEMEPRAIATYMFFLGGLYPDAVVTPMPKFIKLDKDGIRSGCSPDVLIKLPNGEVNGAEIKCHKDGEQQWKAINGGMTSAFKPQVQGSMWITGAVSWDLVHYCEDERLDAEHRLNVLSVHRDDKYIARIEAAVLKLDQEVQLEAAEIMRNLL